MTDHHADGTPGDGRDDRLFGPSPWTAREPDRSAADGLSASRAAGAAGAPLFPRADADVAGGTGTGSDDAETDDAETDDGGTDPAGTDPAGTDPAGTDDGADRDHGRPSAAKPRSGGGGSFLRELPILLVIALVLAFLLRSFVVQVFYIPSSSMEPTLSVNDRMIVEKITYRFRDPGRGEIVVFEGESLVDSTIDDTAGERLVRVVGQFLGVVPASARDFVKRVIGLAGDEILIRDGVVSVNGVPLDEPYIVFEDPSDYGPVTVPEGALFFLGDNRPNSSDSRRGLGFVPEDKVVGRSYAIIWPVANLGLLTGVEHDIAEESDGEAASAPVAVELLSGVP